MKKILFTIVSCFISLPIFSQELTLKNQSTSPKTPHDFSNYGVEYIAPFEYAGEGGYYIGGQVYTYSGWGGEFYIGGNYGLVDSDFAGMLFRLGALYGHMLSDNVLLSTSFGFDGSYHGTGTYIKSGYSNSNASWGGHYYEYEAKNDSEFSWGLSLKPKLVFKIGKIMPQVGLSFNWAEGSDKIDVGFAVGVGWEI